jgi:3-methyladenine DNA glycosylase AlkD
MTTARARQLLKALEKAGSAKGIEGMARFGIRARRAYGVPGLALAKLARETGRDHALSRQLRATGVFEARALAALIAEPSKLTEEEMDGWVKEFENWADCDSTCLKLFVRHPSAFKKAMEWSRRRPEIERRAGFAMMAAVAVHRKEAPDAAFAPLLKRIEATAFDERKMVKKAVNWALRQIGKRNLNLNRQAIAAAKRIHRQGTSSAKWIASDALRELQEPQVAARLSRKQ